MKYYIDILKKFNIGDKVILLENKSNGYCLFTIGHIFKISNVDKNYNKYILIDEDNDKLIIYGTEHISKIITKKESKKKYDELIELNEFKQYFKNYCPHSTEEYDDREIYDVCKKQPRNYYGYFVCEPTNNCIKYYKDFKRKDKKIEQYIRKIKLNTLI